MSDRGFAARLCIAAAPVLLLAAAAEAAPTSFIAAAGSDTGPCTRTQPCRTLQRGIDVTAAGGELVILDSGSYGSAATIVQSITISADGVSATLGNPGAITIDGAGAIVALRGLHLNGGAAGGPGILIANATAVHIESCVIERFAEDGIRLDAGADTELFVIDTIVRDNGADGLLVLGTGTAAQLTVDNSRFHNNGSDGLDIEGIQSAITRAVISGNGDNGIEITNGTMNVTATIAASNIAEGYRIANAAEVTLESSIAHENSIGLIVVTGGTGRISNSAFTNNGTGLRNGNSTIETRQNNTVRGNTVNTVGALTVIPGT